MVLLKITYYKLNNNSKNRLNKIFLILNNFLLNLTFTMIEFKLQSADVEIVSCLIGFTVYFFCRAILLFNTC